MKKVVGILLRVIGVIVLLLIVVVVGTVIRVSTSYSKAFKEAQALAGPEVQTITIDGRSFRDLNKNGRLDVYEDVTRPAEDRVSDLLAQMTLEEKAGVMFFSMIAMKKDGSISEGPSLSDPFSILMQGTSELLFTKHINYVNILAGTGTREMAIWYNNLQRLAERTRLGIPVTVGTDPRNHFSDNPLASAIAGDMSLFPEPLGLAAIGDSLTVAQFADIARREYLALGLRVALHPQVDLATEPRWGRMNYTFGEDAELSSKLGYAYIRGFQGDSLDAGSVACMTKHFSGGGPQREGIDPHFKVQKGQVYPGNNFNYHLLPFEAAFRAGTAAIMPYYGVPVGQTGEDVGFAFNRDVITGLLREKYQFDGIVCTDWGVISDWKLFGSVIMPARAWGMENATPEERVEKVLNAGCDQFGGEYVPELIVELVREGKISEARIDTSVRRLLRLKFRQGLFDNPFVDVEKAVQLVGNPDFRAAGELAQKRSLVLLKNDTIAQKPVLPLTKGIKIYVRNVDPAVAAQYGTVVQKPQEADFAIIRLKAPRQPLKGAGWMGSFFGSGDLDFKGKEKSEILSLLESTPTIVDIYFERPPVIPDIAAASRGLFVNFGATDKVLLDLVFGDFQPQGKLPVEMPSSMEAVRKQKEDLPYDSENPLFGFGFGLTY